MKYSRDEYFLSPSILLDGISAQASQDSDIIETFQSYFSLSKYISNFLFVLAASDFVDWISVRGVFSFKFDPDAESTLQLFAPLVNIRHH